MEKDLRVVLSVLPVFFLTTVAQAQPLAPQHIYLDVGLGQALTYRADSSITLFPDGEISLQPKNSGLPQSFTIGVGGLWPQIYHCDSPYFPFVSLGLYYQHTNLFDTKKPVALDAHGERGDMFSTTDYIFSQDGLMANLKLDIYCWKHVMPYLNIGLGASWNKVKQKEPFMSGSPDGSVEQPLVSAGLRTTAFSYNVGAGLDFPVTEKFWLSLGYSYSNFGPVKAGGLCVQGEENCSDSEDLAHFGNLTTQTVLLTGRYLFA